MSKFETLARPYARAAFEYALKHQDLSGWENFLHQGAEIVRNKKMTELLQNPNITNKEVLSIFLELLSKELNEDKKNFLHLLAENKRLLILHDIAQFFSEYRAEHDKTLSVKIVSAVALDIPYQEKFAKALSKRLQRQVTLQCHVDSSILGGAIIYAGDQVIDGSVRGKLNRMIEFI